MKENHYRKITDAIKYGLDLIKQKHGYNNVKTDEMQYDLGFNEKAVSQKRNSLEFKLAAKLSGEQLFEYQLKYKDLGYTLLKYCKEKGLLQEYY